MASKRGKRTTIERGKRAWSQHVEAATLALDVGGDREAQRAFRALPLAEQARLAFEVARTRRRELCLAYRNVIAVTAGRKHKHSGGRERLGKRPCVIFVVRGKWRQPPRAPPDRLQVVPKYLAAYWSFGDERRLCAVPTDVIAQDRFFGAVANGMPDVEVQGDDGRRYAGNIACAVRVKAPGAAARNMILSCLHVFSPIPAVNRPAAPDKPVHVLREKDQPAIGKSTRTGGTLWWNGRADVPNSFDAQLATIDNTERLNRALEGYVLSTNAPVMNAATFYPLAMQGARFRFLVPDSNPRDASDNEPRTVRGVYVHDHAPENPIEYGNVFIDDENPNVSAWIHPGWCINFAFVTAPTRYGDSGSPVVLERPDGRVTFVGMHIGTTPANLAVVIPAWELLRGDRYRPRLEELVPVNP